MIDSKKITEQNRLQVIEKVKETYHPFFDYEIELRKNVYRITYEINGQQRIHRVDPVISDDETKDVIDAISASSSSVVNRIKSELKKTAKNELKNRLCSQTICGYSINWPATAIILDNGFTSNEENLFLPVEFKESYGHNTYHAEVKKDWIDKAEAYFKEQFSKTKFYKKIRCPETLKSIVVEFAATQSKLFSGREKYICVLQQELIPGNKDEIRWHFEFGDFIEKDNDWEYVKGSGAYDMYEKDKQQYLANYNALTEALKVDDCNILYVEGPGLYQGITKVRITVGPWYRELEITPDMDNWIESIKTSILNESNECKRLVKNKVDKCLDNFLRRDIMELMRVNKKTGLSKIVANLMGKENSLANIAHSGKYSEFTEEEISAAVSNLIKNKMLMRSQYDKDGNTYSSVVISDWGNSMFEEYMKTYHSTSKEARIEAAKKALDEGKTPSDEDAYALLWSIDNFNKKENESYRNALKSNKRLMMFVESKKE